MIDELKLQVIIHASPEVVFNAWLDSEQHSLFTGSPAVIDPQPGGAFQAWDGYIFGKTLEVEPYQRILQTWRTTEFPQDAPDSLVEILFEDSPEGTLMFLNHSGMPLDQVDDYRQGWLDFYFQPMQQYYHQG